MNSSVIHTFSLADRPNRLAQIKFLVSSARGGFTITTFPVSFGEISWGFNQKKMLAVAEFLGGLPLVEREAWLSARDTRWGVWLETGEE